MASQRSGHNCTVSVRRGGLDFAADLLCLYDIWFIQPGSLGFAVDQVNKTHCAYKHLTYASMYLFGGEIVTELEMFGDSLNGYYCY